MSKVVQWHKLSVLLILGVLWHTWIVAANYYRFNSDEAIVGLMARDILQGKPIPTFFYGQSYMGSFDALLTAGHFVFFGISTYTVRMVQVLLSGLSLLTAYLLVREITKRQDVALVTVFLLAIPTPLVIFYTTLSLGAYTDVILFGNIILLLGWYVTVGGSTSSWHWLVLGFVSGMGWWLHASIGMSIGVVGLMGLFYFRRTHWRYYLLAAAMFFVGSSPWWLYNLRHDWLALNFLIQDDTLVNPNLENRNVCCTFTESAALLLLGVTGLFGFRLPIEGNLRTGLPVILAFGVYLVLITLLIGRLYGWLVYRKKFSDLVPIYWVQLYVVVFSIIFVLSPFFDSSGRYLLPLVVPVTMVVAILLLRLKRFHYIVSAATLAILIVFQGGDVFLDLLSKDYDLMTEDEAALLRFLKEEDLQYGYSSYWVSHRLMFLEHDRLVLDTRLPFDERGFRFPDRCPDCWEQVEAAENRFWLNGEVPELNAVIACYLDGDGITYAVQTFGGYTVYYDFSQVASPSDYGLDSPMLLADHTCYQ